MSPLAFCITTIGLAKTLTSELNLWFVEDATLGGHPDVVVEDLKMIAAAKQLYGLELIHCKCEAFVAVLRREKE